MRYGASVFLGMVEAELADHSDCARFQIVCPACHEAVFKGVMKRRDGRETHYFSHYREVPSEQVERCELRVSSITKVQVEKATAEARGQALAIFVARFRECVQRAAGFGPAPLDRMAARHGWRQFGQHLQAHMRSNGPQFHERHWAYVRDTYADVAEMGVPLVWRKAPLHFACGMLAHALAPGSLRQFVDLMGVSVFRMHRTAMTAEDRPEFPEWPPHLRAALLDALRPMVEATLNSAFAKPLNRMARTPDPFLEPRRANMQERIADMIVAQLYNTLYHVPYEDILRETIGRAVRPPRR